MRRLSRTALLFLATLLVAPAVGCDKTSNQSETDESASAEGSKKPSGPSEVVFAFQPQENPSELRPDAERMAEFMSREIGVDVDVFPATNYAAVVEGLRSENADVAYFSGWPYLIADQEVGMDLLVVEERKGEPFYHAQIFVDADSDIESIADLEGRSFSFTSPTSTCGYLFPLAKLIDETSMETGGDPKEFFSEVIYAGGYQQSLQALVHDRVDAAAASDYAPGVYLDEEERDSIRVLSRQGPVPTHAVAVREALPDDLKQRIEKAFLKLNESDHSDLLKSLYGAEKLVERSHEDHVGALAKSLDTVGVEREIEGFGAGSGSGHGSGSAQAPDHGKGAGSGSADDSAESSGAELGSGKGSGSGSGSGHHE